MTFTRSFKLHFLVGLGIGFWLVLFLVLIAPFDASDLSFFVRIEILSVYGVILLTTYCLCIPVQNMLHRRFSKWNLKLEIFIYILLYAITLPPTILYYKSEIVNGEYPVPFFILEQYIPIVIIITPILFVLRKLIVKKEPITMDEDGTIIMRGDNKTDVLRLESNDVLYVASSDNYVEVFYSDKDSEKKKLLRTTLKKIESEFSFLKKVHRSYLVNPEHFHEWITKDSIRIGKSEIPVSKSYRDNLPN